MRRDKAPTPRENEPPALDRETTHALLVAVPLTWREQKDRPSNSTAHGVLSRRWRVGLPLNSPVEFFFVLTWVD